MAAYEPVISFYDERNITSLENTEIAKLALKEIVCNIICDFYTRSMQLGEVNDCPRQLSKLFVDVSMESMEGLHHLARAIVSNPIGAKHILNVVKAPYEDSIYWLLRGKGEQKDRMGRPFMALESAHRHYIWAVTCLDALENLERLVPRANLGFAARPYPDAQLRESVGTLNMGTMNNDHPEALSGLGIQGELMISGMPRFLSASSKQLPPHAWRTGVADKIPSMRDLLRVTIPIEPQGLRKDGQNMLHNHGNCEATPLNLQPITEPNTIFWGQSPLNWVARRTVVSGQIRRYASESNSAPKQIDRDEAQNADDSPIDSRMIIHSTSHVSGEKLKKD